MQSLDTQMKDRSADPMLSRDDGISCSFCPLRAQAETLVTSEAAHPSAGPGQPASPPSQKGAGREGDWNGVTGNKVGQRITSKNESQGQSCLLSSASSTSSITAE